MELELPVRSGVVDGLYTVVLELLVIRILLLVVEGIARQLGNQRINKHGHLRVISTKWTNFLGRGTSASGHLWRVALYAAATVSISLITYGTNGFTKIELAENEVVYVTQTDDVNAQYELAIDELMGRSANWAFASRLQWCTRREDEGAFRVYTAFCDTKLCMESFGNDRVQEAEEYQMLLDHFEENGRCSDGSDAPKREISPHFQMVSDNRRLPPVSIGTIDDPPIPEWTNLNISDKFRLYQSTTEERRETESGNATYLVCVQAFYEDYYIKSYTYMEILAEDLVKVTMPITTAITPDWIEEGEAFPEKEGGFSDHLNSCTFRHEESRDSYFVSSFESFEILVENQNVLVSEPTQWLRTATILSLTDSFRNNIWQSLTMVNLKVRSGILPTDFVQTQSTRISAASIVGFIFLAAVAILLLITLTICVVRSRMGSYEAGNLALNDSEIYGLLKFQANDLGDARTAKANRLELGFSSNCSYWGVLSEQ